MSVVFPHSANDLSKAWAGIYGIKEGKVYRTVSARMVGDELFLEWVEVTDQQEELDTLAQIVADGIQIEGW